MGLLIILYKNSKLNMLFNKLENYGIYDMLYKYNNKLVNILKNKSIYNT